MSAQNYANHRKLVPMFHGVLFGLIVVTLIGSFVNFYHSIGDHQRIYSASLIVALCICLVPLFFFCRIFPLKAQDRAIRAEENFRHYLLTGKPLDLRLTVGQIVALRFACDKELPDLARRAVEENLTADQIKRAITNWKADFHRV